MLHTPRTLSRHAVSADRAYAVIDEQEADGCGEIVDVKTVFLTASECPIGCNMCDLWQNTLETATPQGAIVRQMEAALRPRQKEDPASGVAGPRWIKLYNSGNFLDPNSIPEQDYEAIADLCGSFTRVIVENHPRFGAHRLERFRDLVPSPLEVAVGLETVQPRWLSRLGKQMSRDDFDRYANWLLHRNVDLRVFLIVGVPGITPTEAMRWARMSVRHACHVGARHVSLIPARSGHGWNGLASQLPSLTLQQYADLQHQAISDAKGSAVVTIDVWDIDSNDVPLLKQIQETNLSQRNA